MEFEAPAKINLALHVVGQRDDGYHLLDTLVTFAKVSDRLRVEPSDGLSLTIEGPEAGELTASEDNLVLRAARGLARIVGREAIGAELILEKNLPVSAGIGGGSADAAAAIRGLCHHWEFDWKTVEVSQLAHSLGADVPMCLHGKPAHATGIGDALLPVKLPAFSVVLANPRVPVSTPEVFKQLVTKENPPMSVLSENGDWIEYLRGQRNDLENPAMERAPLIADTLSALRKTENCRLARMSGSGATCFGLYDDQIQARLAAEQILREHPDWWVVATETFGSQ